jgi:hypothetical protein
LDISFGRLPPRILAAAYVTDQDMIVVIDNRLGPESVGRVVAAIKEVHGEDGANAQHT